MEIQEISSSKVSLYSGTWIWNIKDEKIIAEGVVTPRIPYNYEAMKRIPHVIRRAIRLSKLGEADKKKMLLKMPIPSEIQIDESTFAGYSFMSIKYLMSEIQNAPEPKKFVECMIWNELINRETQKEYYQEMVKALKKEKESFEIFPKPSETFNAFKRTSWHRTYVVIVGQDPYPSPGHAHGLSFSSININPPASLHNVYKEIYSDLEYGNKFGDQFAQCFTSANLNVWANQGVLLLNRVLTVRKGEPGSHEKIGWQTFTDEVIKKLNEKKRPIVFMLWGKKAQEVEHLIDPTKHLILKASHPSPKSADKGGFFGCKHFSQCNKFLIDNYGKAIDWTNNNYSKQNHGQ